MDNIWELKAKLKEMAQRAAYPNMEKIENGARDIIADGIKKCFDTGTDFDGNKWAPLKWRTTPKPVRILVLTGKLMAAAINAARTAAVQHDGLVVSMNTPFYADIHQRGWPPGAGKGHGHIPARPFLGFSDETTLKVQDRIAKAYIDYVINGVK